MNKDHGGPKNPARTYPNHSYRHWKASPAHADLGLQPRGS